ncbi:capsule assembly Wzi family protein [Constantimarinum furrinae]|uniref:Capsule assembly Wzi family protein n=1 Tax=Constantimarinum furrinae TaxID=2562285 RepID=A0A7G8PX70_9FLAO|nr:capsule assembly Wzi family protein [Constantimarinum furrinae]QNJ98936.1 hypothetical protein ALE3EI_2398 [Constantimarinum furrinae]
MRNGLIFLFLCLVSAAKSQTIDWHGEVASTGIVSSESSIPFWFYTNTQGELGSMTNFSGTASLNASYTTGSHIFEAGAAFFYRDGVIADELQRRDLFFRYSNNWIKTTLGSKMRPVVANGLSATNLDYLNSGNARPLPGLIIEANKPIKISETFGIDWGIAHFALNDDRFVEDVRVHYKRLGVITTFNETNTLKVLLQHYAQWGGTSPVFGPLKDDFSAFVDVFFARETAETGMEGETLNALGNHLGSLLLDYEFKSSLGTFNIYHDHPFEDGSGTRFANFPDGVWGVFFQPQKNAVITAVLYEYIDTLDQSGISVGSGFDNYFNNSVYRNGWRYDEFIIGMPFFVSDNSIEITATTVPITSNRTRAHHFGLSGTFKKIDWKFKTSYVENKGLLSRPFNQTVKAWYNYAEVAYTTQKLGTVKGLIGIDSSNISETIIGGGVKYIYSF